MSPGNQVMLAQQQQQKHVSLQQSLQAMQQQQAHACRTALACRLPPAAADLAAVAVARGPTQAAVAGGGSRSCRAAVAAAAGGLHPDTQPWTQLSAVQLLAVGGLLTHASHDPRPVNMLPQLQQPEDSTP